jgi:hypothetical protein
MQGGRTTSFNFEVAGVDKLLLSASEIAANGYKGWLDNDYGLVYGPLGAPIYMLARAGVYWIEIFLPRTIALALKEPEEGSRQTAAVATSTQAEQKTYTQVEEKTDIDAK